MTDNEIIKVLKNELECVKRQFGGMCDNKRDCGKCDLALSDGVVISAYEKVLDLINRQKAEIERLKKENEKQKAMLEAIDNEMLPLPFETDFDKAIKTAKSETIKEFAEQLKKRFYLLDGRCVIDIPQINNLLKNNTIPTIAKYEIVDVQKVQHGEWIEKEHWIPLPRDYEVSYYSDYDDCYDEKTHSWKEKYWHCSCCDYEASRDTKPVHKYCPHCGAKMDKEQGR